MVENPESLVVPRTISMSLGILERLKQLEMKTGKNRSYLVRRAIDLLFEIYEKDPSILERGESNDDRGDRETISPAIGDDTDRNG